MICAVDDFHLHTFTIGKWHHFFVEPYRHFVIPRDHRLDRDDFLGFIKDKKPTYPECEAWVLSKKGGSVDAEAVRKLNAAIAGYIHDDGTRKAILGESNIEDAGNIKDAVNLNNLDDWKAFHRDVLA